MNLSINVHIFNVVVFLFSLEKLLSWNPTYTVYITRNPDVPRVVEGEKIYISVLHDDV